MTIFNSYVKLPEAIFEYRDDQLGIIPKKLQNPTAVFMIKGVMGVMTRKTHTRKIRLEE